MRVLRFGGSRVWLTKPRQPSLPSSAMMLQLQGYRLPQVQDLPACLAYAGTGKTPQFQAVSLRGSKRQCVSVQAAGPSLQRRGPQWKHLEEAGSEDLSHTATPPGSTYTADTNTVVDSAEFAVAMAKLSDDLKGKDIMVLHVEPVASWTSYMVFVSVTSGPQLGAILTKLEQEAEQRWKRQRLADSPGKGSWEILDFGDVVVNVMTAASREYYDLEGFYGAAEELELPFVTQPTSSEELEWSKSVM